MTNRQAPSLLVLLLLAACGSPSVAPDPSEVAVWALSAAPTLEIGVLEGDEDYVFQDVASVVRLTSGNIVAADGGASEVSEFDPSGAFVRRWGGRGEGPGEFRNLVRLYPRGTDSLMVLDGRTARVSFFDTAGAFARQVPVSDLSSDTLFAMDVWLYGRFWVDGALGEDRRAAVRAALDRLPLPTTAPGYRLVRAVRNGDLWIREPELHADGTRIWTIVDPRSGPRGLIRIPVRMDPQTIEDGEVLGRWIGESDVHFVRTYDVTETGTRALLPSWMLPTEPPAPVDAPDQDDFMGEIRSAFMGMARAQEIHYSTAMTYTARMDSLEWERPEQVAVDVINAGPRGWVAVFTHPGLHRICALGYGSTTPPGWEGGRVVCGPDAASPSDGAR